MKGQAKSESTPKIVKKWWEFDLSAPKNSRCSFFGIPQTTVQSEQFPRIPKAPTKKNPQP